MTSRAVAAGLIILFLGMLTGHVMAQVYGRAGAAPLNGCGPSYLAMEPDAPTGSTYQLQVLSREARGEVAWLYDVVTPSRARCEEARAAVLTVVGKLRTEQAVSVGACW